MITPFANDAQSEQIGELVIENQHDKITLYGDIDIYQDQQGLTDIQRLHELTGQILQALEKIEQNSSQLPPHSQARKQQSGEQPNPNQCTVDNPFL